MKKFIYTLLRINTGEVGDKAAAILDVLSLDAGLVIDGQLFSLSLAGHHGPRITDVRDDQLLTVY